jgi:tRNA nucleotidyltransferase (CCA-adding enzyme)
MHMPPEGPSQPILAAEARGQAESLRQLLAPEHWPFDPGLLPAQTVLVGGAVRDALLGRLHPRPDLDLVVSGDAIALHHAAFILGDARIVIARLQSGRALEELAHAPTPSEIFSNST